MKMIAEVRLTLPEITSVPFEHYQEAIAMADGGTSKGKKILLKLSNHSRLSRRVELHFFEQERPNMRSILCRQCNSGE